MVFDFFKSSCYPGEVNLIAAIFDQAVLDGLDVEFVNYKRRNKKTGLIETKKITNGNRIKARRWFYNDESNFRYLCSIAGFNASYVKKIAQRFFDFQDKYGRDVLQQLLTSTFCENLQTETV